MAYICNFLFEDDDLQINEEIKITVFSDYFEVECKHEIVREEIINFLEWLDVELETLNDIKLKELLFNEFKIL
jgi:hypothetical protein